MSALAYLFGIFSVNTLFANASFKNFYTATTIISGLFGGLTLLLLFRINVRLGISDEFFCLSNSALTTFINEINYLPVLGFCCRLCPVGMEGTTYAIFTALMNLSGYLGNLVGSILVGIFGVSNTNFSNLWILVVIQVAYTLIFGMVI